MVVATRFAPVTAVTPLVSGSSQSFRRVAADALSQATASLP